MGQSSSTFTFLYPTTLIIQSSGTLQDLTTVKVITLAQETYFGVLNGGSIPSGSSIQVGTDARISGDRYKLSGSRGPLTVGLFGDMLLNFPKLTHICRRSGAFTARSSFLGSYLPSAALCAVYYCGLYVGPGATLTTAELNGAMNVQIDTVTIASGGILSLGTNGVSGFSFPVPVSIQLYGTIIFVGSGDVIRIPLGSYVNFFAGSSFSSAVVVSIQPYDPLNPSVIYTTLVLGTFFSGPYYVTISFSGVITYSTTGMNELKDCSNRIISCNIYFSPGWK